MRLARGPTPTEAIWWNALPCKVAALSRRLGKRCRAEELSPPIPSGIGEGQANGICGFMRKAVDAQIAIEWRRSGGGISGAAPTPPGESERGRYHCAAAAAAAADAVPAGVSRPSLRPTGNQVVLVEEAAR